MEKSRRPDKKGNFTQRDYDEDFLNSFYIDEDEMK